MRILSLATTHPRGPDDSEPAFVHQLNKELVARGHEVTALVPHAPGALRREELDGVRIHRFRYFIPSAAQRLCYDGGVLPNLRSRPLARLNLPFFLLAQPGALLRELLGGRYDLIHAHWLVPTGLFASELGQRLGIPVVATAHAGDVFTRNVLFDAANRRVLRAGHPCTVNSLHTERAVKALWPHARTHVIPMGVDLQDFSPAKADDALVARMGATGPRILFLGRFAEKKGIPYLLRAMPTILEALPGAHLALVGFGPDEASIAQQIAALGLGDRCRILGRATRQEAAAYMASADLFVGPSVVTASGDTEGLGLVFLEALASGTPVVGSDVGGIPDIIQHGRTGLLARPEDPEDIARQCLRMLREPALRENTLAQATRSIDERFSWKSVGERFDALFRLTTAEVGRPEAGA
jgi:glycosyltransferase involved in cell wall biosynthesis